jgi:hypothetical protein
VLLLLSATGPVIRGGNVLGSVFGGGGGDDGGGCGGGDDGDDGGGDFPMNSTVRHGSTATSHTTAPSGVRSNIGIWKSNA